jgi:hypothetical protein
MSELGYSCVRTNSALTPAPEIVRVHPGRGRIVYGETVLRDDLENESCHERLRFFSRRQTRHHSSVLFFIGVDEADHPDLEELLRSLEIRSGTRGGNVLVVPIASSAVAPPAKRASSAG